MTVKCLYIIHLLQINCNTEVFDSMAHVFHVATEKKIHLHELIFYSI